MKLEERYPDTETFHLHNANPWNLITCDCVARALSTALELEYNVVVKDLVELQLELGYDTHDCRLYNTYLELKGWVRHKQPRKSNNKKYTGSEFCKEIMRYDSSIDTGSDMHHVIAHIGGNHIVAIISGVVYDTWDSTGKCIGNYWTKK